MLVIMKLTLSTLYTLTQAIQEYSVRVSFLELYNEELFDLLSTGEDTSKLRIFEDSARKVATACTLMQELLKMAI